MRVAPTCNERNCHMVSCPKCGHQRQPKDDGFFPRNECPRCGIVYAKFAEMQKQSNVSTNLIHSSRNDIRRFSIWNILVWCIIILTLIAAWSKLGTTKRNITSITTKIGDTNGSSNISLNRSALQEDMTDASLHGSPDNAVTWRTLTSLTNNSNRELSNAIDRIHKAYRQPLTDSNVYYNQLMPYQWDFVKAAPNYLKIQSILHKYHRQHTYMLNDSFVCVDMAIDIWNLLETAGIKSRLMEGNVKTDIANGSTFIDYLGGIDHAWVLAEVSPSLWIPLETTGGYIVEPSIQDFRLYNIGVMFENPRELKDFNVSRKAMVDAWKETASMVDNFNRLYAGGPMTTEAAEYTGRMKQKLEDCEHLIARVTVSLQRK